jgi:hypothetical protein
MKLPMKKTEVSEITINQALATGIFAGENFHLGFA